MSASPESKNLKPHVLETQNLETTFDPSTGILNIDYKNVPPGIELLIEKGIKVGDNILLTGGNFDDKTSDKNAGTVKRIDSKKLIVEVQISD